MLALKIIKIVWLPVTWCTAAVGVLYLWPDIRDLPQAYGLTWGFPMWLDRETVAYVMLAVALAWITWAEVRPFYYRLRARRRMRPFDIEFLNDVVNDPTKYCRNKVARLRIPKGLENAPPLQELLFKIGVVNNLKDRTLRNVHMILHSISRPTTFCDALFQADGEEDITRIDIPPGATKFFVLGSCYQKEIIGAEEIAKIEALPYKLLYDSARLNGLRLATEKFGHIELNGVDLTIGVYADDLPPLVARFKVDAKTEAKVRYEGLVTDPV